MVTKIKQQDFVEHFDDKVDEKYLEVQDPTPTDSECKVKEEMVKIKESRHKWSCQTCSQSFKFIHYLQVHNQKEHGITNCFKCQYCDFDTTSNPSLKKHENTHTKDKFFLCDECDKRYNDISDLSKHKASHAGSVKCDLCSKTLKSTFCLSRHKRRMHGQNGKTENDEKHICEVCSSVLKTREYLYKHMKKVHCEPSLMCSMCDKKFKTKYHLKQHEGLHTGDFKTTECTVCGLVIKGNSKSRITSHMESHSKTTNLKCENCEYYFRCQSNLVQHKQIYHGL